MVARSVTLGFGRRIRRQRGFYALVVASLAVGIGAATAVFSVLDATLLRPLPFRQPEALAHLAATLEGPDDARYLVSPANFLAMRDGAGTFLSLEAARVESLDLEGGPEPVRLTAARATPGFLATLGVDLVLGRLPDADDVGGLVLSEGTWSRHFGRDPGILGRTLFLGGAPGEVMGVLPEHQAFPPEAELWLPLRVEETPDRDVHGGSLQVIGRMLPGVGLDDARRDMDRVAEALRDLYPDHNHGRGILVDPLRTPWVSDVEDVLAGLFASVAIFLAIACANVAALMLVRMHRQWSLVGLQLALGASRQRILAEHVLEAFAIAVMAAAGGTGLATLALPLLTDALAVGAPGGPPRPPTSACSCS